MKEIKILKFEGEWHRLQKKLFTQATWTKFTKKY